MARPYLMAAGRPEPFFWGAAFGRHLCADAAHRTQATACLGDGVPGRPQYLESNVSEPASGEQPCLGCSAMGRKPLAGESVAQAQWHSLLWCRQS